MQLFSTQALKIGDSLMVGRKRFEVAPARFKERALDIENIKQAKFPKLIAFLCRFKRLFCGWEALSFCNVVTSFAALTRC